MWIFIFVPGVEIGMFFDYGGYYVWRFMGVYWILGVYLGLVYILVEGYYIY